MKAGGGNTEGKEEREKGEKESGTSVAALIVILLEKSWFANGTGH